MMSGFPYIPLGSIYITESTMRSADPTLLAFLWEEINYAGCGFFCGVELFV